MEEEHCISGMLGCKLQLICVEKFVNWKTDGCAASRFAEAYFSRLHRDVQESRCPFSCQWQLKSLQGVLKNQGLIPEYFVIA